MPTSESRCRGPLKSRRLPSTWDGRLLKTLKGEGIVREFIQILEDYVASHYQVQSSFSEVTVAEEQ